MPSCLWRANNKAENLLAARISFAEANKRRSGAVRSRIEHDEDEEADAVEEASSDEEAVELLPLKAIIST